MAGQSLSHCPLITSEPIIFLFRSHIASDVLFSSSGNFRVVWVVATLVAGVVAKVVAGAIAAVSSVVAAMIGVGWQV